MVVCREPKTHNMGVTRDQFAITLASKTRHAGIEWYVWYYGCIVQW